MKKLALVVQRINSPETVSWLTENGELEKVSSLSK